MTLLAVSVLARCNIDPDQIGPSFCSRLWSVRRISGQNAQDCARSMSARARGPFYCATPQGMGCEGQVSGA